MGCFPIWHETRPKLLSVGFLKMQMESDSKNPDVENTFPLLTLICFPAQKHVSYYDVFKITFPESHQV